MVETVDRKPEKLGKDAAGTINIKKQKSFVVE